MRPGIFLLLWLTIFACVDSYDADDECASFTDVKHETVAERTVTLSFKINNMCDGRTVDWVRADYVNPNGDDGVVLCHFELSNGICDQSGNRDISCTCDDQGTFRVTSELKDDQEVWVLRGLVSYYGSFYAKHTVKINTWSIWDISDVSLGSIGGVLLIINVVICICIKRKRTQIRRVETIELQSVVPPASQQSRDAPPEAGARESDVNQAIPEQGNSQVRLGDSFHIHNEIPGSRLQSRDAQGEVTVGDSQACQVIPESSGYMDMSASRPQPRVAQGDVTAGHQVIPESSGYMDMSARRRQPRAAQGEVTAGRQPRVAHFYQNVPCLGHDHKENSAAGDGAYVLPDGATHAVATSAAAITGMERDELQTARQQSRDSLPLVGARGSPAYQNVPGRSGYIDMRPSVGPNHNKIPAADDGYMEMRRTSGRSSTGTSATAATSGIKRDELPTARQQSRDARPVVGSRGRPAYQNVPGSSGYMEMCPSRGHDHKEIPAADDGGDVLLDGARHAGMSSAAATSEMESSYMLRPVYRP